MQRIAYFILILALFSCNANDKENMVQVNKSTTGKVYGGYDAIRRTILPPLFVLLTNKE